MTPRPFAPILILLALTITARRAEAQQQTTRGGPDVIEPGLSNHAARLRAVRLEGLP